MKRLFLIPFVLMMSTLPALADTKIPVEMKDALFMPAVIQVPAGQKIELLVTNNNAVPAEFESYELDREVMIDPHTTQSIFIGPLDAGSYPIFDDKNSATKGTLVVK